MAGYATGKHAIGLCQRCGFVFKLSKLRADGETNLLVCDPCWDEKHPAERPVRVDDAISLRRPAPDLDAEASREIPAEYDMPLVEYLGWPAGSYFGGGT